MGDIIIIGDVFKMEVWYSPIQFYNGLPSTRKISMNKQTLVEGRKQIYLFLK